MDTGSPSRSPAAPVAPAAAAPPAYTPAASPHHFGSAIASALPAAIPLANYEDHGDYLSFTHHRTGRVVKLSTHKTTVRTAAMKLQQASSVCTKLEFEIEQKQEQLANARLVEEDREVEAAVYANYAEAMEAEAEKLAAVKVDLQRVRHEANRMARKEARRVIREQERQLLGSAGSKRKAELDEESEDEKEDGDLEDEAFIDNSRRPKRVRPDNVQQPQQILVTFKLLNGLEYPYTLDRDLTIAEIKTTLAKMAVDNGMQVTPQQIRLTFTGKPLADPYTLHQCQVQDGSRIHVTFEQQGGAGREERMEDAEEASVSEPAEPAPVLPLPAPRRGRIDGHAVITIPVSMLRQAQQNEARGLEAEIAVLRADNANLQTHLTIRTQQNSELRGLLDGYTQQISELRGLLDGTLEREQQWKAELQRLRDSGNEREVAEANQRSIWLATQIERIQKEHAQVQSELAASEHEVRRSHDREMAREADLLAEREGRERAEAEVARLQAQVASLTDDRSRAWDRANLAERDLAEAEQELNVVNAEARV